MRRHFRNLIVGAALLAAPLTAFGAEDSGKAEKPEAVSTNAVAQVTEGATDPMRESLLRALRPENMAAERLDRLRRELRLRHGVGAQLKDLPTSDLLRLMGDVYAEGGDRDGRGDPPGGAMRPQGRGMPGGPPNGRRGGGRPGFGEPVRGGQMMQISSRIYYGLLEDESGQDPEIAIKEYNRLIEDFNDRRNNMAIVYFRLGSLYARKGDTEDAAEQFRLVLRHFSDISQVAADAEKALKALEGKNQGGD